MIDIDIERGAVRIKAQDKSRDIGPPQRIQIIMFQPQAFEILTGFGMQTPYAAPFDMAGMVTQITGFFAQVVDVIDFTAQVAVSAYLKRGPWLGRHVCGLMRLCAHNPIPNFCSATPARLFQGGLPWAFP
ncbi:hypothetical protein GCM10011273_33270 [Asticcacaulis endophyticus]|uniref:Uncharacterized protein n=1 Tax=Asticcacaulis endophyticus TaxID=1395890 RepID=A0A918QGY3_9CAUL|nr:hypothetical protein GCM10011273_33270 [Asticcacaulis endophyticus]